MKKLPSHLYVLILIAGFYTSLQGQSVNIEQAVSINNGGMAPRAGAILDLGQSNKPLKIPITIQDSIDQFDPEEGMVIYNVDSARYEVNYALFNQVDKGSSSFDINTDALLTQNTNNILPTVIPGTNKSIDSISIYIKSCPQTAGAIFLSLYEIEDGDCLNVTLIATTNSISPNSISTFTWHTFDFISPIPLRSDRIYTFVISPNTECLTTFANQPSYTPNVGLLNLNNCTLNDAIETNVIFHLREKVNLWSKLH